MKKETTEIVVCHVCKGSGILTKAKLTCYHKGEYDYWKVECPHCKGSGLMQQKIVTETILAGPALKKFSLRGGHLVLKEPAYPG